MKTCNHCGEAKPAECFSVDKTGRDGLRARCLDCDAAVRKERGGKRKLTRAEVAKLARSAVLRLAKAAPDDPTLPKLREALTQL